MGLFFCSKNGNSREVRGLAYHYLCGGGMDIFGNYTMRCRNCASQVTFTSSAT